MTLKWFKALKSLINKINNEEIKKQESIHDEEKKERENIKKEIWEKYIFQKWDKYGNFLILKLHEKSNFFYYLINDQKLTIKRESIEDKKYCNIKNIVIFFENIKESLSKKDMEINDFYLLCNFGFPSTLRKKLWRIIIGNPFFITDDLYNRLKSRITKEDLDLNFQDLEKKYNNKNMNLNKDSNVNQIITDVLYFKSLFIKEIQEQNRDQFKLMLSVYKIARVLFLFRSDIPYNKIFIEIIYLFEIVEPQEEFAFINIINFLSNSNFIKLLMGNEVLRKETNNNNIEIFKNLIKTKLPNIEGHLTQLEIFPELYFIPWMDDLYIKFLNLKILLQIFDLYLLNGEYILFQTGLSILKILEEELTNMTISHVLKLLKRLPEKYDKEKFFEVFYSFNGIKSDYVDLKRQNELKKQKNILNYD